MKILVTGCHGQVARSLAEFEAPNATIVTRGRPELDLLDAGSVARAIALEQPDIVVNAAAYTAVDKAEAEPDLAFAINRDGAGAVARAAAAARIPVIQISTDYVFSGDKPGVYEETDVTGPTGIYGRSKLEGEMAVADSTPDHAILRTAWVYSPFGNNFMKTMLRLAMDREVVRVVADQHGTPTYAPDIAAGILTVARAALADKPGWRGLFHMVAEGQTSWAGFAEEIFAGAKAAGRPFATVEPITTADYPTPARRPANSRLSTSRFTTVFGHPLPQWRNGVERCLERT